MTGDRRWRPARHMIPCGCGRVRYLRWHQSLAPAMAVITTIVLLTAIATSSTMSILVISSAATLAAIANQLRITFLCAQLAGTGFCPACTRRAPHRLDHGTSSPQR